MYYQIKIKLINLKLVKILSFFLNCGLALNSECSFNPFEQSQRVTGL